MRISFVRCVFKELIQRPAGSVGQVRPRRRIYAEEAQRPPRGKRAARSGNQPLPTNVDFQQCLRKAF
ncbi:hypothetical protein E0Y62_06655 [Cytobacillus praedii]|uniref:Uncharacterized protein n=1 Tax=Cytobacillus praedii TaxID=1742358 RepID=A0A4R1B1K3_9BACI|nr:hypothetical protein E0Y62_06655 [Cytobacillus praedii]